MNRRLYLNIPQNNTSLLPQDFFADMDHLIGMKFGMGILDDDNTNHLKNKRIRSVADLLQDQFELQAYSSHYNSWRTSFCQSDYKTQVI
jgi:DNA-directed RNA polymerase subunit beta